MLFCGLIGAFIAGVVLDCTKRYDEVAKIALAFSVLSMVWFLQVFNREDQAPNIAVCLCVFGFFAFVMMPACLELGVEITYPVAESTSAGLLWSAALVHAPAVGVSAWCITTTMYRGCPFTRSSSVTVERPAL